MEVSGQGKSPSTTLSFRYNANNEVLEELFDACDDDPPTPQCEPPSSVQSDNASPKRGDKTPSIIDKYFKSMRAEKSIDKDKVEDVKNVDAKLEKEEVRSSSTPKELSSSPMKEYLNRFGKRSTPEISEVKEGSNETWKIFHDFKFKIAQAVEDMKTKSLEETKEKSVPRENSTSDSEENSAVKDVDQQSVGDTDNQVSSLDSSIQNLSEMTQPVTAKATEKELSLPLDNKNSESSDDTHKNLSHSDMAEDYHNDSLDVESGVEAFEDNLDGFGDANNSAPVIQSENRTETPRSQTPLVPTSFGMPPSQSNIKEKTQEAPQKSYILNLTMYILTFFVIINYALFPNSNAWNGFLLGMWFFYLLCNIKNWFMGTFFGDGEQQKGSIFHLKRGSVSSAVYTIPSVKEHTPMKKFEGWINHYRFPDYDPYTYHINKTTTAFVKLEGCNLRISYTTTKVAKRALWDEKIEKAAFYQHRLYSLTGARVILLPKGLVKRRQWSKKYPICVILNEKEKIQVLEKENVVAEKKSSEVGMDKNKKENQLQNETESTETNTSPEKKKKFVWRRREKSVSSHTEGEPGREGLRHRLVRKMHRDKKTDSVSTSTEPVCEPQGQVVSQVHEKDKPIQFEDALPDELELATKSTISKEEVEDDLDDNEMTKLKELLEESELEAGADSPLEGEWSVHVKNSNDRNSCLFFFGRTGRDKLEWYRRLTAAVLEAKSAESSTAEDKSGNEPPTENKDGTESPVNRAEKDTVSFAKSTNKITDLVTEGVTITSLSQLPPKDNENYEKLFWPYLLKIIQTKTPSPDCDCRMLPAEVTWLNTALARIMFDVMRDPILIARVQARIQKKLNTLKLPSFMSPLVVTELSLSGACPLVERVLPPSWDARGVWLDADLRYEGGAYIALLTQINLMKLKEKNMTLEDQILESTDEHVVESPGIFSETIRKRKPAVYDSEVEDSAESSSDDESPPMQPVDSATHIAVSESTASVNEGVSSKRKFLRMVDKIATNKYFQQVTDYKYVKRAMEGLSNTDIKLHLEIHGLEGRLAFNLPPPPHDRLWIGFRTNPQLVLKARPAVGARTLRFAHISNWIEQKLSKEFEKVLVLPNMEDLIIDVMTPTPVEYE